jgi:hypothetical protein
MSQLIAGCFIPPEGTSKKVHLSSFTRPPATFSLNLQFLQRKKNLQYLEWFARTGSTLPSFLFDPKQGQMNSKHTVNIPAVVADQCAMSSILHQATGMYVFCTLCLLHENIMGSVLSDCQSKHCTPSTSSRFNPNGKNNKAFSLAFRVRLNDNQVSQWCFVISVKTKEGSKLYCLILAGNSYMFLSSDYAQF